MATTGDNVCGTKAPAFGRTAVIGIPVVVIIVGSTLGKNLAVATSKALVIPEVEGFLAVVVLIVVLIVVDGDRVDEVVTTEALVDATTVLL